MHFAQSINEIVLRKNAFFHLIGGLPSLPHLRLLKEIALYLAKYVSWKTRFPPEMR
jgi:hypothetical protein